MMCAYDFRDLRMDGYTNINDILPIKGRLHACETLFGDKEAEIMLLGQDAASAKRMIYTIVKNGEGAAGFRHGEGVRTNINISYCLKDYLATLQNSDPICANNCNIFYANAIWLLKNTETMSGSLRNLIKVMNVCKPVFDETYDALNNLKLIIPLGKIPYFFLRNINANLSSDWQNEVKSRSIRTFFYRGKEVLVAPVRHPSPLSGGRNIEDLKESFDNAIDALK